MSLGERVFVMSRGELMQIGSPNDVYWRPNSRFVADFMGRTNWITGHLCKDARTATFCAQSGWTLPVAGAGLDAGKADLCIRPESIEVVRLDPEKIMAGTTLGRIVEVTPLGPIRQMLIELDSGDRLLVAQPNRADQSPAPGEPVAIAVPSAACTLFPASV